MKTDFFDCRFRIEKRVYVFIKDMARRKGLTVSQTLRMIICDYVEEHGHV